MRDTESWQHYTARIAAYDRCRMMILAALAFYPALFMGIIIAGFAGYEVDTYTAVSIVFHVFPLGAVATMALFAAFNLYVWIAE